MPEAMTRRGRVLQHGVEAGIIQESAEGFRFHYTPAFLATDLPPVSLTLPKRSEVYESPHLFAFFVSILAEGSLAAVQCRRFRLDENDYFGRLLATAGEDVVGSVQVRPA